MENSELGELLLDQDNVKRFNQNTLILEIASLIYKTMQEKGVKPSELAGKLGVTKGRISHYLGGENNLRMRTLADIFTALDCKVHITAEPLSDSNQESVLAGERVQKFHSQPKKWDFLNAYIKDSASFQLAG